MVPGFHQVRIGGVRISALPVVTSERQRQEGGREAGARSLGVVVVRRTELIVVAIRDIAAIRDEGGAVVRFQRVAPVQLAGDYVSGYNQTIAVAASHVSLGIDSSAVR